MSETGIPEKAGERHTNMDSESQPRLPDYNYLPAEPVPPSYDQAMGGASNPSTYYPQTTTTGAGVAQVPSAPSYQYQYQYPSPGAYAQPANPTYGYSKPTPAGTPQAVSGGMVVGVQPGPTVVGGAGQPGYPGGHYQAVVITQPHPLGNPPPDYLIFSILSCIFCCWPIGIIAIIYSVHSRDAARRGDETMALIKGQSARKACITAVVLGVFIISMNILIRVIVSVAL